MNRRISRLIACMTVAAAATVGGVSSADAATTGTESVTSCGKHQSYVGSRWLTVNVCSYGAQGWSGYTEDAIYLDRATSSQPSNWTGWLGVGYHTYVTQQINQAGYYWRTCVHETRSGRYYCTGWFNR
jgi:hypothetical protein